MEKINKLKLTFMILLIVLIFVMIFYFFIIPKPFFNNSPSNQRNTIKIGYIPISHSLPFFVALEKNYFEQENINVEAVEFATTNELIMAFMSNKIDATAAVGTPDILLIEQNYPNKFKIYVIDVNSLKNKKYGDFILIKKNSSLKSLSDLKNKKLGVFPSPTITLLAKIILEKNNISIEDINLVPISPSLHLESLSNNEVDAIFSLEPIATIGMENNLVDVLEAGPIQRYVQDPNPGGVFIISTNLISEDKETAQKIINSVYKGIDFMRSNESKARVMLSKYTSIPENLSKKIYICDWWKINETQIIFLQDFVEILYNSGMLEKRINVNKLLFHY